MSPRKSTTKQGYMPLKNTIFKKTKIWAAIFLMLSGCETIQPLKVQNPKHQFLNHNLEIYQATEKVISFLIEKNFEIKTMGYHTIVTEDKAYTTSVISQKEKKENLKGYFIANCTSIQCPTVGFILTVQITTNKISMHYSQIRTTPNNYSATPTFTLKEELEAFLKN